MKTNLTVLYQSLIFITGCNELGILHSESCENEDALKVFEIAHNFYNNISKEIKGNKIFYSSGELNDFEVLFTHTTFFLAQHYGNYGDKNKASYYSGLTLYRELEYQNYDAREWIKICLSFSELFFSKGHINMAIPLIEKCEELQSKSTFDGDKDYELEAKANIEVAYAGLYVTSLKNCWTLHTNGTKIEKSDIPTDLLEITYKIIHCNIKSNIPESIPSTPSILPNTANQSVSESTTNDNSSVCTPISTQTTESESFIPPSLPNPFEDQTAESDTSKPSPIPDSNEIIPDNIQSNINNPSSKLSIPEGDNDITYEEAKQLFKSANSWYNKAKMYFILDGFVTEHIEILKNQSKLYYYLCGYEQDYNRKITMNKKRAVLLEPLVGILNPSSFSNIIYELHFELGDIYISSYDFKSEKIKSKEREAEENGTIYKIKNVELEKLRLFAEKAIEHFTKYTKYFYVDNKKPDILDEDSISPYLNASFNIARMYSKLGETYVNDLYKQLIYGKESYIMYKHVAEMSEKYQFFLDDTTKVVLEISRDMRELLPSKLDKISAEMRK